MGGSPPLSVGQIGLRNGQAGNPSRGEGLWDGTINGKDAAPQGVYVYKIRVKDFNDKTHHYVGNVTLIR